MVKVFLESEMSITVEFGEEISQQLYKKVHAMTDYLDEHPFEGMIEYIPSYTGIMIIYDPVKVRGRKKSPACEIVKSTVEKILNRIDFSVNINTRIVRIPVCYGGEFGPDLEHAAKYCGISSDEFIKIHSGGEYLVYMIGFAPGFPYLGGMPPEIEVPRKKTPRTCVPEGSVAVGGKQTGVYSISTPGGWNIIGRTPVKLFRTDGDSPSLLKSGDIVKFFPISNREYKKYKVGQK